MDLASPAVSGTSVYANGLILSLLTQRTKTNQEYLENMSASINSWDLFVAIFFFFPWFDSRSGPRLPKCWGLEITLRHATIGMVFPGQVIRPRHRPLTYFTQHSKLTDIHARFRIWTGNPSKQAAAGPCLRLAWTPRAALCKWYCG